eukprot:6205370-Pleurochrysis_carterae.AAC.4
MATNIWRYGFSIDQVQAGRSTPNMAYLAINAAHVRYAAFYACQGAPYFFDFGSLAMRKISSSQEKHQFSQVPEILLYPWLLPDTIMAAITDLGEGRQLATTHVGSHLKVFKVSPIVSEMSFPGLPTAYRGSPARLRIAGRARASSSSARRARASSSSARRA